MALTDPIEQGAGNIRVSFQWADFRAVDRGRHIEYTGRLVTTPASLLGKRVLATITGLSDQLGIEHVASVYGENSGSSYDISLTTDRETPHSDVRAKGVLVTDVVLVQMAGAVTHPEAATGDSGQGFDDPES